MEEKIFTVQDDLDSQLMSVEDIQDWLASQIAEQLGVESDEVDIRSPFDSYGLDSLQIMSIANQGKQYYGLQLSPLVIWNYPNIESLSRYLAEKLKASEREVLEL
ncbi:MAG: acyl carrier protein [Cyanobacteria bacterium J06643_13]